MQSPWIQLRSASRHPFIYQRMLADADERARPGDAVAVYDKSGSFFGRGLYNPRSQIALRMLTYADEPIDESFWRARIADAVALRSSLRLPEVTDAYRLVHAEGDGLSGLVAERYADCIVLELFSLGVHQRGAMLARLLAEALGPPAAQDRPNRASPRWRIALRADEEVERREGFRLAPEDLRAAALHTDDAPPQSVTIREHGVRYRVDVQTGHKTGFFCDQRDNRRRFAALCRDAQVLDLCCYSGGFGLCAKLLGAARDVTSVDLDEAAIAMARENANLNQARVEYVHADVFVYLRQMIANGRQFDVVVLDPPKLAYSREGLDEALAKYYDMNVLAASVVRPGGVMLTCSCSGLVSRDAFVDAVHRAARRAGRRLQLFAFTGAAPDHPVMLDCPESAYLKAMWLRVAL
ncbi:MAG: class I SAM-dependent rRNA methyltransferase [Phycisphaerae bacterium]